MNKYLLINLVKKFNQNKKPECVVKTIKNKSNSLLMEFSGTVASHSCCFDEYFNDLSFLFEDESGIKLDIKDIKRRSLDKFLVDYKILNINNKKKEV